MTKTISIFNQKGGVGKSTSALNLAAAFSRLMGKKVLLIDLDAQTSLTSILIRRKVDENGVPEPLDWTIYDAFSEEDPENPQIIPLDDRLHFIPSSEYMACLDMTISNRQMREFILRDFIDTVKDGYDLVILDCPGAFGILSINIFAATDILLVPVTAECMPARVMRPMELQIEKARKKINPHIAMDGIFLTAYDKSREQTSSIEAGLRRTYGGAVLETAIRRSAAISEFSARARDIFAYEEMYRNMYETKKDITAYGKLLSARRAADDYRALAQEIKQKFNI